MLLVFPAAESDLKGHVSIVFLPVPLESAPVLTYLGRFEGWMLEYLRGDVQATAASLLHWKSGSGIVDHFKTWVPGLDASSSVPVWKGMPKVEEDQRSTVSLVSRWGPGEFLSSVVGTGGLDVYAMVHGKTVNLISTFSSADIVGDCTVYIHHRLRGGFREDVPGQWTCSQCFAPRCWPVRIAFFFERE